MIFFLADMKRKFSQMMVAIAASLSLATVPSCVPEDLLEEGGVLSLLETLGGTTSSGGEMYDEYGNPIYGYDGDQPVYGYDSMGLPIYFLAALTADSTVPQWEPLPGATPRPHGVRRGGPPPHARHRHGDRLKRPGDKTRRFGGHAHQRSRGNRKHDSKNRGFGHADRSARNHSHNNRDHGKHDRADRDNDRKNHGLGKGERLDRNRGKMERGQDKSARADRKRSGRDAGMHGRGEGGNKKGHGKP